MQRIMSVDVEEWFNILDIPREIPFEQWHDQENRLVNNMEKILDLFREKKVKATLFFLAFFAEKYPDLVREAVAEGHEIASHGYAHVLAYKVGREKFREDIRRGKDVLENIIQQPVQGFRAAGFSTTDDTLWTFEEVRAAGYLYDSSVFPTSRGHGGMNSSSLGFYTIDTPAGSLLEIPQSVVTFMGKRFSLFGGGYLRLAPYKLIQWGISKLEKQNHPLIVYIHPREIDPEHPRLPMPLVRRFKSYVNLNTTYSKLATLCDDYNFVQMRDLLETFEKSVCNK